MEVRDDIGRVSFYFIDDARAGTRLPLRVRGERTLDIGDADNGRLRPKDSGRDVRFGDGDGLFGPRQFIRHKTRGRRIPEHHDDKKQSRS